MKINLKKIAESLLIVCLISTSVLFGLFLPQKTQAAIVPVAKVEDKAPSTFADARTQGSQEAASWKTAIKELWEKRWELAEWASGTWLNLFLHQILATLTNQIVNWIENGQEPRFLSESLGEFLWDAADKAAGAFIDQYLGMGWLCEPFDLNIRLALLQQQNIQFQDEVNCTLSDMLEPGVGINDFYHDFMKGGWKGWVELTKSNNNFYGAFLSSQEELAKLQADAEADVEGETSDGDFLPDKECIWYDATGRVIAGPEPTRGYPQLPDECKTEYSCYDPTDPSTCGYSATPGVVPPCRPQCRTKTPAQIIESTAIAPVTSYLDTVNQQIAAATAKAGPYAVYIQAIANSLINRVMKEGYNTLMNFTAGSPNTQTGTAAVATPFSMISTTTTSTLPLGGYMDLPLAYNPEGVSQMKETTVNILRILGDMEKNGKKLVKTQKEAVALFQLIPAAIYPAMKKAFQGQISWCSSKLAKYPSMPKVLEAERNIEELKKNQEKYEEVINKIINAQDNELGYALALVGDVDITIPSYIPAPKVTFKMPVSTPRVETAKTKANAFITAIDNWTTIRNQTYDNLENPDLVEATNNLEKAQTELMAELKKTIFTARFGKEFNLPNYDLSSLEGELSISLQEVGERLTDVEDVLGHSAFTMLGTIYGDIVGVIDVILAAENAGCMCLSGVGDKDSLGEESSQSGGGTPGFVDFITLGLAGLFDGGGGTTCDATAGPHKIPDDISDLEIEIVIGEAVTTGGDRMCPTGDYTEYNAAVCDTIPGTACSAADLATGTCDDDGCCPPNSDGTLNCTKMLGCARINGRFDPRCRSTQYCVGPDHDLYLVTPPCACGTDRPCLDCP